MLTKLKFVYRLDPAAKQTSRTSLGLDVAESYKKKFFEKNRLRKRFFYLTASTKKIRIS